MEEIVKRSARLIPAIPTGERPLWPVKWALGFVLILAAVLRFSYFFEMQSNPMPFMTAENQVFDQYNYRTMALDLMQSHWLGTQHPGHSPVYSYLIALIFTIFGPDINAVFIFQMLYGILAVYLFYRCGVLLFENKNIGLLAALMAAMYSPFIYYECALLRESVIGYTNLTAFFFFLLALRKGKAKNFVFAGMMAALSLILRAGIMPILVLAYILIWGGKDLSQRVRRVLLVMLGMAIVISPLTIRNHLVGFKALTETSGPTLFWLGNTYDSPGIGLTYTESQKQLTAETEGKILKTVEVLSREIKAHPAEYKSLWGRKFKMLFNGFEIPANLSFDLFREQSWVLKIAFLDFVLVSPLALLAFVLIWKKFPQVGLFYTFVLSLTVFVLIFHIQSRYRVAFLPFFVLAASYSLWWFWKIFEQKNYLALQWAAGAFVVLFCFTFPDTYLKNRYFDGGIRTIDYSNMANAYLLRVETERLSGSAREYHLRQALKYYDKAILRMPREQKAYFYMVEGIIYRDLNLKMHALNAFSKSLEIYPDNPVAQREYKILTEKIF